MTLASWMIYLHRLILSFTDDLSQSISKKEFLEDYSHLYCQTEKSHVQRI